jgi:crossover junction endodeoxyribonuclease RusA
VNEQVVIILALPARILSPNASFATLRGRFAKASAAKKQRRMAYEAVMEAQIDSAPWGKVSVSSEFFCKTNRRRDTDNAMASLKAVYDGIVDSGLVEDDTPEYMRREEPKFNVDKVHPRLVLTLTRLE